MVRAQYSEYMLPDSAYKGLCTNRTMPLYFAGRGSKNSARCPVTITMCPMPTATRCEMDSSRIGLVPRQMYPLGICSPNARMRMPIPAASMIALGTTVPTHPFHYYTLADPLSLIRSGKQRSDNTLSLALIKCARSASDESREEARLLPGGSSST